MEQKPKRIRTKKDDIYYTPSEKVEECILIAENALKISSFDTVVDPSCGEGAFLIGLSKLIAKGAKLYAVDINPIVTKRKAETCGEQLVLVKSDFLDFVPEDPGNTLVIGNVPFGIRSKDAKRFFTHAASFANAIAFVVPAIWAKTAQNAHDIDTMFHIVASSEVFPRNTFKCTGMRAVFMVFARKQNPREIVKKEKYHVDFAFVRPVKQTEEDGKITCVPPQDYDFAMRTTGWDTTGKVMTRAEYDVSIGFSPASFIFIKAAPQIDKQRVFRCLEAAYPQLLKISRMSSAQNTINYADITECYEKSKNALR